LQAASAAQQYPSGPSKFGTPRVQDYDVAGFEIHSNARSSALFNYLTSPAEDIEWMSVKNLTTFFSPLP
jgi:hypothetical protein